MASESGQWPGGNAAIILVYETPGTGGAHYHRWRLGTGGRSWESDHQDDQDDDDVDAWV